MEEQMEVDSEQVLRKSRGGGTTCCVVGCGNNTRKNPEFSYHKFPKDATSRKEWLHWVGREDFAPKDSSRVCSAHFPEGKKTFTNNIPTVTTKIIKPTPSKPRATFKCRERTPLVELKRPLIDSNEENCDTGTVNEPNVEHLKNEILALQNKLESIKQNHQAEINALNERIKQSQFSLDRFKSSDSDIEFYTGFQNYSNFDNFYKFLSPACEKLRYIGSVNGNIQSDLQQKRGRKRALSPKEELFMVLSKLRCGLLERDLANRYNISVSQVSNIWITWINFLHGRLRAIPIWPSRTLVDRTMPPSLKELYPKTRVIIDCTEIFIEMPTSPATQSATFSSYKHHNTAKGLVGITPAGALSFVSELYAGRTSDKELTLDCGLLHLLEPGDDIMADRGFTLAGDDLPGDVSINIPPFLNGEAQLSQSDEVKTRRIAKQRIHVERFIEKIKNFRILQQIIPLSMAADINKIWSICCHLTLFFKPLVVSAREP